VSFLNSTKGKEYYDKNPPAREKSIMCNKVQYESIGNRKKTLFLRKSEVNEGNDEEEEMNGLFVLLYSRSRRSVS